MPYLFAGPPRPGAIGELAVQVFRERYAGLKGLRSPDFPLLNRLLGGESPTHGELLSHLFFEPEFIDGLIDLGRSDAEHWLRLQVGPERPWQLQPLQAFIEPPPPLGPPIGAAAHGDGHAVQRRG